MYQRQCQNILKMEEENVFVWRVGNYPVVASTLGQMATLYTRCKDTNTLLKYSLETAESGVKLVTDRAAPLVTKFDGPFQTVNTLACSQLDKLEHKYPLVTKPTDEVLNETMKLYESTLKPGVDRVQTAGQNAVQRYTDAKQYSMDTVHGAKQYSLDTVNGAKQYSLDTVNGAKQYSLDTVHSLSEYTKQTASTLTIAGTQKVNAFLDTPQGKALSEKLDGALEYAEVYIDKYLPEGDQNAPDHKAGKASTRLYNRTMRQMKHLQMRSQETLDSLQFTVNLIEYARENLESVNSRLTTSAQSIQNTGLHYWHEIRKYPHENGQTEETLERRAVIIARRLSAKLRDSLYAINDVIIPDHLLDRLNEAREYATDLQRHTGWLIKTTHVEEFEVLFTKVKGQLANVQEIVLTLADGAFTHWPLNILSLNYEISEFDNSSQSSSEGDIEMENVG